MKRILEVIEKISLTELKAVDAAGRSRIYAGAPGYKVGDSILVVNDIIIQKVKREDVRVYDV